MLTTLATYTAKWSPAFLVMLIVLMILFVQGCKDQKPDAVSNLTRVQTFGDGFGEGFISQSLSIASDRNGNLFIADRGRSGILQYTTEGEFVRIIGSSGQGPGEFGRVFNVHAVEGLVSVIDYRNYRITFFDIEGELTGMIGIEDQYMGEFALSEKMIVMGARVNSQQSGNLDETDRFNLFDFEGNHLFAFGTFLPFEADNVPARMSGANLAIADNLLHVVYGFFPLYQIYDLGNGDMLAEYNLEDYTTVEGAEENSQSHTYQNLNRVDVTGLHEGLDVIGDRVFIRRIDKDRLYVEEFLLNGTDLSHIKSHIYVNETGFRNVGNIVFEPASESLFVSEVSADGYRISEYALTE